MSKVTSGWSKEDKAKLQNLVNQQHRDLELQRQWNAANNIRIISNAKT